MLMKQLTGGTVGGGINGYEVLASEVPNSSTTHTLSNMKDKKVIFLLYSWAGGMKAYDYFDGATTSDGSTITKLSNFTSANAYAYGTIYQIDVKTNSCVVSQTNAGTSQVIGVN